MINLHKILQVDNKVLTDMISTINERNCTILFITKYGSHLYGTNTPDSDLDIKGIFIPSMKDVLLKQDPDHFTFSSGDKENKNCKDDIDIQFLSIYKFVDHLVKGEINSIDILFAFTNKECVIYKHDKWDQIVSLSKQLISKNLYGLKGYTLRQARMYGIKGSRLHDLKKFKLWLDKLDNINDIIVEDIINKIPFNDYEYISKWYQDSTLRGIKILDKKYQNHIRVCKLYEQIDNMINKYGSRSKKSMENNNVDYKALSHAYRACLEIESLLRTGEIKFPFKGEDLDKIMKIKTMQINVKYVLKMIEDKMDQIESLKHTSNLKDNISVNDRNNVLYDIVKLMFDIK